MGVGASRGRARGCRKEEEEGEGRYGTCVKEKSPSLSMMGGIYETVGGEQTGGVAG